MIQIKTLEGTGVEEMHMAFLEAFFDYSVQIDMPLERFQSFLASNGFVPGLSVGAFEGEKLCGFIFNGVRQWQGVLTAYDGGTGVVPSHRKQGLTTNMFETLKELLRGRGVQQYLLEVIQTNIPAYNLYLKMGFAINREFNCYRIDKEKAKTTQPGSGGYVIEELGIDGEMPDAMWDFHPSWQNSCDSVAATMGDTAGAAIYLSREMKGYGIINTKTGGVYQLAVDKGCRRQGMAGSLLAALCGKTESDRISFINIDTECECMCGFLTAKGFNLEVQQYEMVLGL
jgi:ribosomal protein S18 acetylase RimI-like enzyme